MQGRLYFRNQNANLEPKIEVSKNPSREVVSTTSQKPQKYKNTQSSQTKFVKNGKVEVDNHSDSESEGGLTFDKIVSEKPGVEVVAKFIQNFVDKIVRDDESETSDFESSEYCTDR